MAVVQGQKPIQASRSINASWLAEPQASDNPMSELDRPAQIARRVEHLGRGIAGIFRGAADAADIAVDLIGAMGGLLGIVGNFLCRR